MVCGGEFLGKIRCAGPGGAEETLPSHRRAGHDAPDAEELHRQEAGTGLVSEA